jgi:hypothetical protein
LLLQTKMRVVKNDLAKERKARQDRLRELVAEKRAVARPLESLKDRVKKLSTTIAEKKADLRKKREELETKKAFSGELKGLMREFLETVSRNVEAGIPWRKQFRQDSIQQAMAIVEDEKSGLFPSLAAVGRIHGEEEHLARHVELSTIELPYAGKKLAIQGFHFGLLAVIYANEDGSVLGFVQAGEELKDGIKAVEDNPFAEEGYLAAVDILRRRRTPGIVDLYLPTLPVTTGGGQ